MLIALKVDVDTLRGTREGVPALLRALQRAGAGATFLFSLGPDHTGRAIKRVFRPNFIKKVSRTSVLEHYGLRTLLNGTLLPGPDIGKPDGLGAEVMRRVRDAGFEVGIHCWDHVKWQDGVGDADGMWTEKQMRLAVRRFEKIFGHRPRTHGAAGWQMNRHALRLSQQLDFDYCSDGRGSHPFLPVHNAEFIRCPQLPTTLPTLDELIGVGRITKHNVAEHLLALTANTSRQAHIFTLHAELEGMKLLPQFEQFLIGWKAQGYRLVPTRTVYDGLQYDQLPRCEANFSGAVEGRSGTLFTQGKLFLKEHNYANA